MSLSDWSSAAQIVTAMVTLLGVFASMYMSVKALREVQLDRKLRQTPYLAFVPGGHQFPVCFVKAGRAIPGVNSKYVQEVFNDLPEDAESIRIKHCIDEKGERTVLLYGKLCNYGLGPALQTHVTWVPQEIYFGTEKFDIDDSKLSEPKYSPSLNRMPLCPEHILPSQTAQISRLPTFIEKDVEKRITQVTGFLLIKCNDIFKQNQIVQQGFYLSTDYKSDEPTVHVTFLDIEEL